MAASHSRRSKAPELPAMAAHPSEQELITSFLRPRLSSSDESCKFVHDADVYAAHPADLTRKYTPVVGSNGEEAWYFFTAVRAKGGRKARTVDSGEGIWHSETGLKPVAPAGTSRRGNLGHRQSFSFVTKEDGQRVRSGWLMVELGVDGDGQDELTLCKVYFSPRAKNNKKPAAAMSSSGSKRKAAASKNPDASAPVSRQRRRARPTSKAGESDSDGEMDDPVKEDGALGKNSAADEADEPEEEEDVEDSHSWWMRNKLAAPARLSVEDLERPHSTLVDVPGFSPPPPPSDVGERSYFWFFSYEDFLELPEVKAFFDATMTPLLISMRSSLGKNQ